MSWVFDRHRRAALGRTRAWLNIDSKAGTVTLRGQKTQRPLRVAMLAPALDALPVPAR